MFRIWDDAAADVRVCKRSRLQTFASADFRVCRRSRLQIFASKCNCRIAVKHSCKYSCDYSQDNCQITCKYSCAYNCKYSCKIALNITVNIAVNIAKTIVHIVANTAVKCKTSEASDEITTSKGACPPAFRDGRVGPLLPRPLPQYYGRRVVC